MESRAPKATPPKDTPGRRQRRGAPVRARIHAHVRILVAAFGALCATLVGAIANPNPASAADGCASDPGEKVAVRAIDGRGEPVLADGRVIYLPDLAFPHSGATGAAVGAQVRAVLGDLLTGRSAALVATGPAPDRWGRTAGRLYVEGSDRAPTLWVEQELVRRGLARIFPGEGDDACAPLLLAAEANARDASLGLWRDPYYAVLAASRPDGFAERAGEMIIVQGRILSMGAAGGRTYLNFGPNRRHDLALVALKPRQRRFDAAGSSLASFVGRMVRARGELDMWFSPRIEIDSPAQIEIVSEPTAPSAPSNRARAR